MASEIIRHQGRSGPRGSARRGQERQVTRMSAVVRVHYKGKRKPGSGAGLHVWGDVARETAWNEPLPAKQGAQQTFYWDVELKEGASSPAIGLILHEGEDKLAGGQLLSLPAGAREVWLQEGDQEASLEAPLPSGLSRASLRKASAHWRAGPFRLRFTSLKGPGPLGSRLHSPRVSKNLLLWRMDARHHSGPPRAFHLLSNRGAQLALAGETVLGPGERPLGSIPLGLAPEGAEGDAIRKFPHLMGCTALSVPDMHDQQLISLLRCPLAVSATEEWGELVAATGIQCPGVLDECYAYDGPLGARVNPHGVSVHLWAPTAQQVELLLWDQPRGGEPSVCGMWQHRGVWSVQGPGDWQGKYYQYRVRVYTYHSGRVETVYATDPYALCCSADGLRTQIVDLGCPDAIPEGWHRDQPPRLRAVSDTSLYELHIRDFSASDTSVPAQRRGKYSAFLERNSAGVQRLKELRAAGLTHVHLLPAYDFGSVPERPEDQQTPKGNLGRHGPASEAQQAAVWAVAATDAFNWGYDPVHFSVPEGSYASSPDGLARVREFRAMVAALHGLGLRVVLDVVYNHTYHSGADGVGSPYSVLDKIVPGYYHRRAEDGALCASACCNNTAPEHAMAERLVIDDLLHWARQYRVDGFRFDIMGHLLTSTMVKARDALRALSPWGDGVDGQGLYLYGEAWDFGEMAHNQRGRNASQLNMAGLGIGSFNDRIRDAVMGGSPFASPQQQGFATGLQTASNSYCQENMSAPDQLQSLLSSSALLRLSMAGNLKGFEVRDAQGASVRGSALPYFDQPAGYAAEPCESINYVSCHDNHTLFDQVMLKAAEGESVETRVRRLCLAEALVALAQGIPFFHAGDEHLRSKSLDRDSYNSGDHFNMLDWTCTDNNFGVGLPPAAKNKAAWGFQAPLLRNAALRPSGRSMQRSRERFLELLRIRYSCPLFRLPSAEAIGRQVTFYNDSPQQVPGVLFMEISSAPEGDAQGVHCPTNERVLVLANARREALTWDWPGHIAALKVHPIHAKSVDRDTAATAVDAERRTLSVAALTAVVFVTPRTSDK